MSLYALSRPQLSAWLEQSGEPRYRADQLWHWMYGRLAPDFASMTSLPLGLRARLEKTAVLHTASIVLETTSRDALADKLLLRLRDGQTIETVLMHYLDPADDAEDVEAAAYAAGRHTVCLSTQVGCAMGCVFCATGQMGLLRDLDRGECVEQVVICARRLRDAGARLSNVVFMGMGEPLANWTALDGAIETLVDPRGLAMSPRRITVSTVGIVPGIRRLAEAGRPVRLAVSLHAPDDDLRTQLVPMNDTYPLAEILAACQAFQRATGRRVTVEYVLIRDVNDRVEQARRLAALLRPLRPHVNLIPLNPTAGNPQEPSRREAVAAFAAALEDSGLAVTARMRRGIEIDAGCGQLREREATGRIGRTVPGRETVVGATREES